jgi:hypothetical protein
MSEGITEQEGVTPTETPTSDELKAAPLESSGVPENILGLGLIQDESLKESPALAKFKDVDGLAKGYVELEKFKGGAIKLPTEEDDTEGWNKVYSKLGVPEDIEGYEIEEREFNGLKFGREEYADYLTFAKENNLSVKQVKALADYDFKRQTEAYERIKADNAKVQEEALNGLKMEFGDKYESTENTIKGLVRQFTNEDESVNMIEKVTKDPALFKLMAGLSTNFSEDNLDDMRFNSGGMSTDQARDMYNSMLNDKSSPLHDPSHPEYKKAQDKHMDLFKRINNIK